MPNAFGLYDMLGNVGQWAEDCYHDSYDGAPSDGLAWTSGECKYRILRGGTFGNASGYVRSAYRGYNLPDNRSIYGGFRVARMLIP